MTTEKVGLHTAIDRTSDDVARALARMLLISDEWSTRFARKPALYRENRVNLGRLIPAVARVDGEEVARTLWVALTPELHAKDRRQTFATLLQLGAPYAEEVLG